MSPLALLDNLRLRAKLAVLILPLLLGCLILAAVVVLQRREAATQLDHATELALLSSRITAVLHESQRERGQTSLFYGSSGTSLPQALVDQRKQVDARLADLNGALAHFDARRYGGGFGESLRRFR